MLLALRPLALVALYGAFYGGDRNFPFTRSTVLTVMKAKFDIEILLGGFFVHAFIFLS